MIEANGAAIVVGASGAAATGVRLDAGD